ncbi:MAG: 3-dehydroquinate synthase, partial [Gammaproteobacteria bacterium]|nr:3-dehydroquinate synthase [Gammaproteobacteria bacterium]
CQGYGEWLHGEAVAAGMIMAAKLSGIDDAETDRLRNLVIAAGLPAEPPDMAPARWHEAMGMDKKVQGKMLRFVLLRSLGSAYITTDYDSERLESLTGGGD